jgi:hypothetical protein
MRTARQPDSLKFGAIAIAESLRLHSQPVSQDKTLRDALPAAGIVCAAANDVAPQNTASNAARAINFGDLIGSPQQVARGSRDIARRSRRR